nr:hypothetical protein [Rhodovulum sp. MB263]
MNGAGNRIFGNTGPRNETARHEIGAASRPFARGDHQTDRPEPGNRRQIGNEVANPVRPLQLHEDVLESPEDRNRPVGELWRDLCGQCLQRLRIETEQIEAIAGRVRAYMQNAGPGVKARGRRLALMGDQHMRGRKRGMAAEIDLPA